MIPIETAAAAIRAGDVVAYPTETFYALGADPGQPDALSAVMALKGRDARHKPLLLLVASRDHALDWVEAVPEAFESLVARFWPGPLTIVVPARPRVPPEIVGPTGGVALRWSPHPIAQQLIRACGCALTGTSANPSGAPPCRDPESIRRSFGARTPAIVDAGETPGGPASTLLDLTSEEARILRPGAVSREAIEEVLPLL